MRPMKFDYDLWNRRLGPWVSLAMGLVTLAVVHRGYGFAPVAVSILVAAWTATAAVGRWLGPLPEAAGAEGPWRRRLRTVASSLVVGLYQNVLFYLLPIWFGSATWPSANLAFPTVLAAMALFSCFEYPYRRWVLDRPVVRAAWSAVILFAALVPAVAWLTDEPLRVYVAAAAAASSLVAVAMVIPTIRLRSVRGSLVAMAAVAAWTALMMAALPLLPPVPLVRAGIAVGTGVQGRELIGEADRFMPSTPHVYAWVAIEAPPSYRQGLRFEWYREGHLHGRPVTAEVTGGRKGGYRTWARVTTPQPGDWRVDVVADSDQLVARARFTVAEWR